MKGNQHEQLLTELTAEFETSAFTQLDDEVAATCSGGLSPVTLYDYFNFTGSAMDVTSNDDNLDNDWRPGKSGWNNRTSSIIVRQGVWQIYESDGYRGRSAILRPGVYPNPASFGLADNTLTAIRRIG